MTKVLILGAGLIGKPMALDLIADPEFQIGIADISSNALNHFQTYDIEKIQADLRDTGRVRQIVSDFDYVINAVPGFMGYKTLKTVIEAGKHAIDISFYAQDPFQLSQLAIDNQVTVICDMGVAPGMSHLLAGYSAAQLEHIHKIIIYVGGLPVIRSLPWEYKAVFSPTDVIEEYIRPARLIENGQLTVKPALSESELLDFPGIGTLEAFNSDGLRSLTQTIKAEYMVEKTLRYPGHIALIHALKQSGFFAETPIPFNNTTISPIEFTQKILFPQWKLGKGEHDLTVMRILVDGLTADGNKKEFCWDLFDRYDPVGEIHSMARTTGYAATAALRLLTSGTFSKPGLYLPEQIGEDKTNTEFILNELQKRSVIYTLTETTL